MGHFYGARNGDVVISPKKVNLRLIQAVNACFEAKFTPIIDYRQIFLMCILYVAVELIVDRKQYERQICMRSHWWSTGLSGAGATRAAGSRIPPAGFQPGWLPALRSVRLVVPGKILINSFIYEEPK